MENVIENCEDMRVESYSDNGVSNPYVNNMQLQAGPPLQKK